MSSRGLAEQLGRLTGLSVSRETFERLAAYEALLRAESKRQNLIAESTLDQLWTRHILDSAQLVRFSPFANASWGDVGSGAGLPGIVIACLIPGPVTLIEPRRLRSEFLHRTVEMLELNATVIAARAERVEGRFDVITARAVANLSELLKISAHLSTRNTVWALPKGRNAMLELAEAKNAWQGVFHVEQSVTDPESRIIVASGVAKR